MPGQTPSQTVGPFFSHALTPAAGGFVPIATGQLAVLGQSEAAIVVEGTVHDGAGDLVADALVEVWQADADGRYPDGRAKFSGFARQSTDDAGRFRFETVKPGAVEASSAPHLNVVVFARGMLNHLFTRIYFGDEAAANAQDPVLQRVPQDRREALVAQLCGHGEPPTYGFDIHLQGDRETVFFDV